MSEYDGLRDRLDKLIEMYERIAATDNPAIPALSSWHWAAYDIRNVINGWHPPSGPYCYTDKTLHVGIKIAEKE